MSTSKVAIFTQNGHNRPVNFVETIQVAASVECDVYTSIGDNSQDLAIVYVAKGHKTPRQKILHRGYLEGKGTFLVQDENGRGTAYAFPATATSRDIPVKHRQIMQWQAAADCDLTFNEICKPPYEDGRYENLPS